MNIPVIATLATLGLLVGSSACAAAPPYPVCLIDDWGVHICIYRSLEDCRRDRVGREMCVFNGPLSRNAAAIEPTRPAIDIFHQGMQRAAGRLAR